MALGAAILDGFGDVLGADFICAIQISDGAGELEDLVVGAGAEGERLHGVGEDGFGGAVDLAVLLDLAIAHSRVAGDAVVAEAPSLNYRGQALVLASSPPSSGFPYVTALALLLALL